MALSINIRLNTKSFPGTNTLAYYQNRKLHPKKVSLTLCQCADVRKTCFFVSYEWPNKLECLSKVGSPASEAQLNFHIRKKVFEINTMKPMF
jgi:hypothetical protein